MQLNRSIQGSIVISEWYFLNPASRMNSATMAASNAATSASVSVVVGGLSSEAQLPSAAAAAAAMDTDVDLNGTVTSHDEDTVIYQDGVAPTAV